MSATEQRERCVHCGKPPCVNPLHLFLGTKTENQTDCRSKGRGGILRGEENGSAKLTAADVEDMRRARKQGLTELALSGLFGVGRSQVHRILSGAHWA